ncbi:MAG: hypothetical protein AYK18_15020 [Theionarchaea archaeon DG-70]|nr:MAG: hypothetical protein AYK18_15020 [Theionarchaea archaeon DG-70]
MKKVVVLVVLLLLNSIDFTEGTEQIKVLVDESRVDEAEELEQWMVELLKGLGLEYTEPSDPRYSFENTEETFGFGTIAKKLRSEFSVSIKKSGKLSYASLSNFDVLIICSFQENYSSAEIEAIKQFVENGGGLFFVAHYNSPNNSVSEPFGVLFPSEKVYIWDEESKSSVRWCIYISDLASHPITDRITQILIDDGVPIISYESGEVLAKTSETSWANNAESGIFYKKDDDEDSGPFGVLLVQSMGKGRTVFFGGRGTFYNSTVEEPDQQNTDLLINVVRWLGEPGGPYKQYVIANERAQQMMSDAKSLYENHEFSRAKQKLEDAVNLFTQSNDIYPNAEGRQGIEEAESYIEKCETGMKADAAFAKATELFNQRKLEDAIKEFGDAQSLYEEIGYTAQVEACTLKTEESRILVGVQEEALTLFDKAQDAQETAPSTFSTAGYEEAKSLFEQSKSKWEQYNDPEQVARCEEQIVYCENEIASVKKTRAIIVVVVVMVVAGGAAVMVLVKRRSKSE